MTKLTLSVEEDVLEDAKRLAAENRTSVSAMFSRFIRAVAGRNKPSRALGPLARKASGLVSLPQGETYGGTLEEALLERGQRLAGDGLPVEGPRGDVEAPALVTLINDNLPLFRAYQG